jgi:hypothetical protein
VAQLVQPAGTEQVAAAIGDVSAFQSGQGSRFGALYFRW